MRAGVLLAALLCVQCLRSAAGCSNQHAHAGAAASAVSNADEELLRSLQRHQRRRLRQADPASASSLIVGNVMAAAASTQRSGTAVQTKTLTRRQCAQEHPDASTEVRVERWLYPHTARLAAIGANARAAAAPITIDVHFHVLRAGIKAFLHDRPDDRPSYRVARHLRALLELRWDCFGLNLCRAAALERSALHCSW